MPYFAKQEALFQQVERPINAESQCGKIALALARGESLTTLDALRITGGTDGDRRLREVKRTFEAAGIVLKQEKVTTLAGAHIKRFTAKEDDRQRIEKLLKVKEDGNATYQPR